MSGIKLGQSTLGGMGSNFSNTAEPVPSFNLNLNTKLTLAVYSSRPMKSHPCCKARHE
ncbi:MAG: hypothetical protein RSC68_22220 [Acinetobacter sp.]